MESAIADSGQRFEIPGIAEVVQGNGGLPKVRITSPEVAGEMYMHGGHVTSWKPAGTDEVLLSAQGRVGRTVTQFVEAFQFASLGLETRRTTPTRRRTASHARRRGSLNQS